MSKMNIFNLLFWVLMHKVSVKKDAVFWVVAVCSSSRNLPKCQINLLPPSSIVIRGGSWLLQSVAKFSLPKMAALLTSFLHSQCLENLKS
jgi:hypothetical protein